MPTVRVMSRKVEKVHSREDDEETTQQGDCVDCIGGIETLEENERSAERSCRERHIVEGVDTMEELFISTPVLAFVVSEFLGLSTHIEVEKAFNALLI